MINLFYRGFSRIYFFYKKIVKEVDPFMQFWYTSFAISLLIIFVLNFVSSVLFAITKAGIFSFGYKKFLIFYGLLLFGMMTYFFKNRIKLETKAKEFSEKISWKDYIIILLICFALVCSFAAPVLYKNIN